EDAEGQHDILRVSLAGRVNSCVIMCIVRCMHTCRSVVLRGEFKKEKVKFRNVSYFNTQNAVDLFASGGCDEDDAAEFDTIDCFVLCRPPLSL
ncbi:hypothetical protein OAV88_02295, partial [bacterium]|nr:hypothetical protein [bacterium]